MSSHPTSNSNYDPGQDGGDPELVLNVMKTDPYPTVTPYRVVQRTNPTDMLDNSGIDSDDYQFTKFDAHHALNSLVDAGWVARRDRGLYDLIEDPRGGVPSWPVEWENHDILPKPHPLNPPGDLDITRAIHKPYRNY